MTAEEIRAMPAWTAELPTEEGYYWWRIWGHPYQEVGYLYQDDDGDVGEWLWNTPLSDNSPFLVSRDRKGGEWYGPLEPPE